LSKISKIAKSGIAERIRILRGKRDLSATAFAKLAHVTPAAVWQWENNGTEPRDATLATIAQTFGVTKDFLLTGKENADKIKMCESAPIASISRLSDASLEELIRAIEAKGFLVSIRSQV
jgi:transcriptional regulator with XRE-family HTH domain